MCVASGGVRPGGLAGFARGLSRIVGAACLAGGWLGALLFALVAVLMVVQVCGRALGYPMVGGDEITGWMSANAAFVALGYAFREGALIRMEIAIAKLGVRRRRIAELAALAVGGAWCGYAAYAMARFVWQNAAFGERSTGLISVPIWPIQLPAAIGLALLFVAFVEQFLRVSIGDRPLYATNAEATLAGDDAHSAGI